MKRWLDDERITALTNAGRLRESNCELVRLTSGGVGSRHAKPKSGRVMTEPEPSIAGVAPGPLTIPKTAPGRPVTSLYPIVTLCRSMKIAEPVPEYRFHPTRKWRLDYAWPMHMVALEVDGGVWTQGRHTRGKGAIEDMEKASEAAILGWRLLYCTPEQAHNGVALDRIIRALTDRAAA